MKKINKMKKKICGFFGRYINGTRGAISILMAIIMSPLLSVSLLLVESVRYQNAIEALCEITGCSSFSVLADYDPYLDERFGLLAISQESNINEVFAQYMNDNLGLLENSITLNRCVAAGCNSFRDPNVIKQQLLEYSEVTVASEVLIEGLNLDDLIDQLEEKLGLDDVKEKMEAISTTADIANSVEQVIESIVSLIDKKDDYETAVTEYNATYSDFVSKSSVYITAIQTAEQEHTAEEEVDSEEDENAAEEPFNVYDDADVTAAWEDLSDARDRYKTAVDDMNSELDGICEDVNKVLEKTGTLAEDARELQEKIGEDDVTIQWVMSVVEQITSVVGTELSEDLDDAINPELQALETLSSKLSNLSKTTMDSSWTTTKVQTDYAQVSITSVSAELFVYFVDLEQTLSQSGAVGTSASMDITSLLDVINDIMGLSLLYDTSLNSNVNASYFYQQTIPNVDAQLAIESMKSLITACEDFAEGIEDLNVIELLKAVGNLLVSIASFVLAVITWVGEVLVHLGTFIASGPTEWYNSILLYGYGMYNCPNRTTYKEGKSVSGYEYKEIFTLAGGQYNDTLGGTLSDLGELNDSSGGSDQMFKGAEGEYLLVGSKSEIMNQSVAFLDVFLFRIALNMYPVLASTEVKAIAAPAGPAAWAVIIAIMLAEALLDTTILVNDGDVSLIKGTHNNPLYCTPSGVSSLVRDLVGVAGLSDGLTDKIKDVVKAESGDSGGESDSPADGEGDTPGGDNNNTPDDGGFKVSYSEHLLLLMILSVDQSQYLQRMQNLIQLEAACKYKNDYVFTLQNTHTYVKTDITYTLNPMFNIDALTENGAFTKTKTQYTGY